VYVNIGDNVEMAKFLGLSKALNLEKDFISEILF
jgi:hypothetical protein